MKLYRVRKRISDGSSLHPPGTILSEAEVATWRNLGHLLRAGMLEEVPAAAAPAPATSPAVAAPPPLTIDLEPVGV